MDPFLGEIRFFSCNFAPRGWAMCNGQTLPINQNQALFSLFGTTYGGNGVTTFQLPNLQGRVPIHAGSGHTRGEVGGEESHTLSVAELPEHTHQLNASEGVATTNDPSTSVVLAQTQGELGYGPPTNLVAMAANSISNVGGSQAHSNMQPYLTLNACIALQGIFPS